MGRAVSTIPAAPNFTTYFYSAFVFNGVDKYSLATPSSGRPEDTLAVTNPLEWIYSTGATTLTPPSVGPDLAYAVSNDTVLHSMSSADGDWPAGWRPFQRMEAPAQGRPSIIPLPLAGANKVIFPDSQDGHVYAVDAETGSLLWRKALTLDDVQASLSGMFSAFGGAHDLVMVGTRNPAIDNVFFAVNPSTGEIAWSFNDGGGIGIINGQAVVDYPNQRVYFASYEGVGTNTLWCLEFDASSVNLKWSKPLTDIGGSPVLYRGRVYVGTTGGVVIALDPENGGEFWNQPLGDGTVKGFVWPDGIRLYVSTDNTVWELRDLGASASIEWGEPVPGPSVPLLVVDTPHLYVGGGDGKLYELDRTTNPPTSKVLPLGVPATVGAPSLDVVNQLLYVGTSAGRIYALTVPLP